MGNNWTRQVCNTTWSCLGKMLITSCHTIKKPEDISSEDLIIVAQILQSFLFYYPSYRYSVKSRLFSQIHKNSLSCIASTTPSQSAKISYWEKKMRINIFKEEREESQICFKMSSLNWITECWGLVREAHQSVQVLFSMNRQDRQEPRY